MTSDSLLAKARFACKLPGIFLDPLACGFRVIRFLSPIIKEYVVGSASPLSKDIRPCSSPELAPVFDFLFWAPLCFPRKRVLLGSSSQVLRARPVAGRPARSRAGGGPRARRRKACSLFRRGIFGRRFRVDGSMGRWVDRSMGRWVDGSMGRREGGEYALQPVFKQWVL